MNVPDKPWSRKWQEVVESLGVRKEMGLRAAEAKKRRKQFGPNLLREIKRKSVCLILADQFKNLMTALLAAAAALSFIFGDWIDGFAIGAVTVSFLTLAFAQLWHVFNMRDSGSGFLRNEVTRNLYVWGALALCTVLLLGAVYLPVLSMVLDTVDPGSEGWPLIISTSFLPLAAGQILKRLGLLMS
jgi:magnesium-transporting ATPase (P-type)